MKIKQIIPTISAVIIWVAVFFVAGSIKKEVALATVCKEGGFTFWFLCAWNTTPLPIVLLVILFLIGLAISVTVYAYTD